MYNLNLICRSLDQNPQVKVRAARRRLPSRWSIDPCEYSKVFTRSPVGDTCCTRVIEIDLR